MNAKLPQANRCSCGLDTMSKINANEDLRLYTLRNLHVVNVKLIYYNEQLWQPLFII